MTAQVLVFDLEVFSNYFLCYFRNVETGNSTHFELYENHPLDIEKIRPILQKNTLVSFNGIKFDFPILFYALAGATNTQLKACCDYIIGEGRQPWQCEQKFGFKISQKLDHIDLIDVAPGKGSLKAYGGRLHCKTIQDLPIDPSDSISPEQRQELITYCGNDLQTTIDLYTALKPQLDLRREMSKTYNINLMHRSDAQIAEAVIKKEVERLSGNTIEKPKTNIRPFKYKKPGFIYFETEQLQKVLKTVCDALFVTTDGGKTMLPKGIANLEIKIGNTNYALGVGGIHSQESSRSVVSDNDIIFESDVRGYYPSIILQQKLYPDSMGKCFLSVYNNIVTERVFAKIKMEEIKIELANILNKAVAVRRNYMKAIKNAK